ncbi:Uncharacterised protein [uncultured archaeon]|nr:Uncharacterised protein [uncultured archaeon]
MAIAAKNKSQNTKKTPFAHSACEFIKNNKIFVLILLASTIYFCTQHFLTLSWDFSAYVLNAKYFLGQGAYFEPFRPPLAPALIGILSIFGWKSAEYIYIIIVSVFFAYSSHKLAKALSVNPTLFYALLLTPFALAQGMLAGTELLSLALLELGIAYALNKKPLSGLALGAGMLTRYQMAMFTPIFLLDRNKKRFLLNIGLFFVTLAPWFIYNYIKYGNFLTSIADQYALNVLNRADIIQPAQIGHLLAAQGIFLPLMIIGIILCAVMLREKAERESKLPEFLVMIYVLAVTIYGYIASPLKDPRYLFLTILPAAYFSIKTIEWAVLKFISGRNRLHKTQPEKVFLGIALIVLFAGIIFAVQDFKNLENRTALISEAAQNINSLGLGECKLSSSAWVLLNYEGINALTLPKHGNLERTINLGAVALIFYDDNDPTYPLDENYLNNLPTLFRGEGYVLFGTRTCMKNTELLDKTFLEIEEGQMKLLNGTGIETEACKVIFQKNEILQKICLLFNGKTTN